MRSSNYEIDVIFVFAPGGAGGDQRFKYNLGAGYVRAYIEQYGFKTAQYTSESSVNVSTCVESIINTSAPVVGFTVYDTNYIQSILIARALKKKNSQQIIVFGGPTPTVKSDAILKSEDCVDFCVRGEGEETFHELISQLKNNKYDLASNKLISSIEGISYKNDNTIFHNNDRNCLIKNRKFKTYIDNYPSPYLSGGIPAEFAPDVGIITARGCNQNCTYCNCAVLSNRNVFQHSVDRVVQELEFISNATNSNKCIYIFDDAFTLLPERAKKICNSLIQKKIKLPLSCVTRCDLVDENLLNQMLLAGFESVGFSLESATPRVLRKIGKVCHPNTTSDNSFKKEKKFIEKLKDMTQYAKNIGFRNVFVSIMIGLPSETLEEAKNTIDYIDSLNIDSYMHNIFAIYEGTPIHSNYEQFGYQIIGNNGTQNFLIKRTIHPFDVHKVPFAKNSFSEKENKNFDLKSLKVLSMVTEREKQKPFFDNVIILSKEITDKIVNWLTECLAINGHIIHVLPNDGNKPIDINQIENTLYDKFSPSFRYKRYGKAHKNKTNCEYYSFDSSVFDNIPAGIKIYQKNTVKGINDFHNNKIQPNTFCLDFGEDDVLSLHKFCIEISKRKDPFNFLLGCKPLPYFSSICRWSGVNANCHLFETVIIKDGHDIHLCWNGDKIGNIDMPFSVLYDEVINYRKLHEKEMACNRCSITDNCSKCFSPSPLYSYDLCMLLKSYEISNSAKLIKTFDLFKDL